jgi:hypothetical protein
MGSGSIHNTHGPINWFSQFSPYRRSFRLTGGGSTDGVSSPFFIFYQSIITFVIVNRLLKFLFHHPMNYYLRSLFNYFTTPSKNVNTKNKKPPLFQWWLILFQNALYNPIYTISTHTHSQLFLVNVYQRLLSICVLTTIMLLIYIYRLIQSQLFFIFC